MEDLTLAGAPRDVKGKGRLVVSAPPDGDTLPWTEKYRPQALGDLISHDAIISTSESSSLGVFLRTLD
jgi:hypothetical protein